MAFCRKCGKQLSQDTSFCPQCGNPAQAASTAETNRNNYDHYYIRAKVPGRGFGIAGMVLGIIAVVYCLGVLALGVGALASPFRDGDFVGMALAVALVYSSLGVMAILLSGAGQKRGYVNGISKSGMVMGSIASLICGIGIVLLLAAAVV